MGRNEEIKMKRKMKIRQKEKIIKERMNEKK